MNLKNSDAFKNYVKDIIFHEVKITDAKISETKKLLKNVALIKSYEDIIAKAMVYQWMKKRVLEHLLEKEDVPFFERINSAADNDPDWIKKALKKKEAVYFFDKTKVPAQFKKDLEYISKYLELAAKDHLHKALDNNKTITLDMLKYCKEYNSFASVLYMANNYEEQKALEEQEQKKRADKKQDTKHIADLGDGFSVVRLFTEHALDEESKYMRHCVGDGDYDKDVESGRIQIYSIRDKEGMPHATIEVKDNKIIECKGKTNRAVVRKYIPYVRKFVLKQNFELANDFKNMGFCKDINGNLYDIYNIPEGTVFDELDLSRMDFTELPKELATCTVKRLNISGCTYWNSFKNFPKGLEYLDCRYTGITSLEGCPKGLKKLDCSCTKIASLEGCSESVEDINCSSTSISSLKGCPENATHVNCSGCPDLETLEGCPKGIRAVFCYGCSNLKYIPAYIPNSSILGLSASKIAICKLNWLIKNKEAALKDKLGIIASAFTHTH